MKRNKHFSTLLVLMFVIVSFWMSADKSKSNPIAVSPGSASGVTSVWQSCPNFSWSAFDQAASYKIAVFVVVDPKVMSYEEMASMTVPVISKDIPGPALSYTLSSEESLKTGSMYAWYVRALDAYGNTLGNWSDGNIFKVEQETRFAGIEEKLGEKLQEYGVDEDTIANILGDMQAEVKEVVVRISGSDDPIKNHSGLSGITSYEASGRTFFGLYAGTYITTGFNDTFIGESAGHCATTGYYNTFIGQAAGYNSTTANHNTFLGNSAGDLNTTGHYNTFIGSKAGHSNTTGCSNVFLGYRAGYNETESNRLYIDNSDTSSPLIYGQFDTNLLKINGDFRVTGYLSLDNGITQISSDELNLLDGKTLATGSANNNKLVTQGYVDDNSGGGLNGEYMTGHYLCKWDDGNTRLVDSLISENGGTVGINGNLSLNNFNLSLNSGATQISSTELNLLDGKTVIMTGPSNNDKLVTQGYVDANDDVGTILFGSENDGNYNVSYGYLSGNNIAGGDSNAFFGYSTGENTTTGIQNSFFGNYAGYLNNTGSSNVFIGYKTGYSETGSNKLYIDNSETSSPLIYGEFDKNIVTINGKLGVGTKNPKGMLEVENTGVNVAIVADRKDGATNFMNATASYSQFGSVTNHPVRIIANKTWKMLINTNGSLRMSNGATCTVGGVWKNASSRDLKENIQSLSTCEAIEALNKLDPVKYNYKVDKTDKYVGFIAEDVPDLVAAADRKSLSTMDITAVLTKVVQEQQKMIQNQQQVNREYKKIISDLQERIAKIEQSDND